MNEKEKELPLALKTLTTELTINPSFEKSLETICEGHGKLSEDFQKITKRINSGTSVQQALLYWAEENESTQIKRIAMQLIFNYENHGNPQTLKKLSEELLSKQKNEMREYSKNIVIYSIAFIGISAVFPALFQAFIIIGTSFMTWTITPQQALLIPILGFPLLDMIILIAIRKKRPFK